MRKSQERTKPIPLNWKDPEQLRAAVLAGMGFSNECIRHYCPTLTDGQIGYRVHKSGLKRSDYRNGTSFIAKYVIQKTGSYAEHRIEEGLPQPKPRQRLEEPMKMAKATV
jgi:hypothetical protein